ncbi:unnamed protein product, partial [Mesorhabditis belari]|uniref:Uncharacterized protein n=1 Tax=Mesorhabditis belari TaxID=2138241 RepID=A0AAF3EDY6_9BILA
MLKHDNNRAEILAATGILQRLLVWEENDKEKKDQKHKSLPIWIKNDDLRLGEADRFARRAIRKGIQKKDPVDKAYDNLRVHIRYNGQTKGHKPTDGYQPSPIVELLKYEFGKLKESLRKDCKEDFPSADQPDTSQAQPDTSKAQPDTSKAQPDTSQDQPDTSKA